MRGFEWTKKHTTILLYTCGTILVSVLISLMLLFPGAVFGFLSDLYATVSPIFFGFIIAYLLNPLCELFDKKVFRFLDNKMKRIHKRAISVFCTFVTFAIILAIFLWMVVPQLEDSYRDFEGRIDWYIKEVTNFVNTLISNEEIGAIVNADMLSSSLGGILITTFGAISNIADVVFTFSSAFLVVIAQVVVSFIFAGFFLIEKEVIISWFSRLSDIIFPSKFNAGLKKWIGNTNEVFGSFISGKVVNALIITVVNFAVFGIADIPYYPLIAVITGVTDMIPYFGPFIGAVPCAFIIFIADPIKAIWFGVLVLVIQQIDGNFVGPKILGEKVGVDSLLVIVAITVSGGMFGIVGMFIGVPVFTLLYRAVNEFMARRLEKKGLPTSLDAYKEKKGATK